MNHEIKDKYTNIEKCDYSLTCIASQTKQERLQEEEKKRREDMEIDFLAPFLAQIGDPEKINRKQAYQLKEDCLADLKQRLIDKANLIQARFEKVCRFSEWYVLLGPIASAYHYKLELVNTYKNKIWKRIPYNIMPNRKWNMKLGISIPE